MNYTLPNPKSNVYDPYKPLDTSFGAPILPPPPAPLTEVMDRLAEEIDAQRGLVANLGERLALILIARDQPTVGKSTAVGGETRACPLYNRLDALSAAVAEQNSLIHLILNNLAL